MAKDSFVDTELVPGTIRLFGHGAELEGIDTVTLVPRPTSDPRDPLTWSQRRKQLHLFSVNLVVLAIGIAGNALYSIYTPLSEGSGLTVNQLIAGVGYLYLAVGFFPLLTQPFALAFGKRLTYLASLAGAAAFTCWAPSITSNGQWIVNRLLMGLVTASSFTLCEASIADVFFAHERSFPMGVYVLVLYASALVAPLLGAYIYPTLGFNGVLYLAGGFCALSFIFCFFFLEESNFDRPSACDEDDEEEKKKPLGEASASVALVESPPSYLSRLQVFYPHPAAGKIMWEGFVQPILMLQLPIVWWASLQYGIQQVWFNVMNQLASSVLASPPYNFGTGGVGLAYISPLVISIPSALLFGAISDRWSMAMARRNGGISEPEHKLWLMLPLFVIMPLGLLMMGCGAQQGAHWIVYIIGMGILDMGGIFGTDICLYYVFDCFHEITPRRVPEQGAVLHGDGTAPYLLSLMMPAMSVTFGFNYAIGPWTTNLGLQNWSLTAMAVSTVFTASVIPVIIWGKDLRRRGAPVYIAIIER